MEFCFHHTYWSWCYTILWLEYTLASTTHMKFVYKYRKLRHFEVAINCCFLHIVNVYKNSLSMYCFSCSCQAALFVLRQVVMMISSRFDLLSMDGSCMSCFAGSFDNILLMRLACTTLDYFRIRNGNSNISSGIVVALAASRYLKRVVILPWHVNKQTHLISWMPCYEIFSFQHSSKSRLYTHNPVYSPANMRNHRSACIRFLLRRCDIMLKRCKYIFNALIGAVFILEIHMSDLHVVIGYDVLHNCIMVIRTHAGQRCDSSFITPHHVCCASSLYTVVVVLRWREGSQFSALRLHICNLSEWVSGISLLENWIWL